MLPDKMSDYSPSELVLALRISGTSSDDIYRYLKEYNEDPDRTVNRITSRVRVDTLLDRIDEAKVIIRKNRESGIGIITMLDESFPRRLIARTGSCVCLFFKGDISLLESKKSVSVSGFRNPAEDRMAEADSFMRVFARKDVTLITGLGEGCEARCCETMVDAGGHTVAVLAEPILSAVDSESVKAVLATGGLVVSECYRETNDKHRFGERDRIIGMLSAGSLIVESGESLAPVVRRNMKDGKKVFALEGNDIPSVSDYVSASDAYRVASELINRRRFISNRCCRGGSSCVPRSSLPSRTPARKSLRPLPSHCPL